MILSDGDLADWLPSAWRLGFLAKKFGFLKFLAKILATILGKVRKKLQDFSRSWKEIQENPNLKDLPLTSKAASVTSVKVFGTG